MNLSKICVGVCSALIGLGSCSAYAFEYKVNAFGSLYYAQALEKDLVANGFTNFSGQPNFLDFSLIGGELRAKVSDDLSFYVQVVAIGGQSGQLSYDSNNLERPTGFVPFVQFFEAKYSTPIEGLEVIVGRQAYPTLMTPENFRITFDQPYRMKPTYIYNLAAFSAFDGIMFSKDFKTSFGSWNLAVFGGAPVNDYPYLAFQTYTPDAMWGIKGNIRGDGWRVRGQVSKFRSTYVTPPGADPTKGPSETYVANTMNISLGYQLEKFNLVNWAELSWLNSPEASYVNGFTQNGQYFRRYAGFYELLGYRIGDFMPRYTFSKAMSQDATYPGEITSHIIGLNYYASQNIVLKGEVQIDTIPDSGGTNYLLVNYNPYGTLTTTAHSIYAGMDFKF